MGKYLKYNFKQKAANPIAYKNLILIKKIGWKNSNIKSQNINCGWLPLNKGIRVDFFSLFIVILRIFFTLSIQLNIQGRK